MNQTTEAQRHREEKKKGKKIKENEYQIPVSYSSLSSFLLCVSVSLWLFW
jgi:hypothetical protein